MKILVLTPTYFPLITGNAVTVHRIVAGISQRGIKGKIINLSQKTDKELLAEAISFSPDIIHCFHAYKGGSRGLLLKEKLGIPLVTTMTGTDVYIDLKDHEKQKVILNVLKKSDRITVFNDSSLSRLIPWGIAKEKIYIIHQSVLMDKEENINYRLLHGVTDKEVIFLMTGGIRPVKRIRCVVDVLTRLRKTHPHIRLFLAGPILEKEEFEKIEKKRRTRPWITYLEQVQREHIPSLYRSVDAVINASASESEANSLLEAFYFHKLIIARKIPGNASFLSDQTALLFRTGQDLYEKAQSVSEGRIDAAKFYAAIDRLMQTTFSNDTEIEGYQSIYRQLRNFADTQK
ncbi:MAG: glycosyltransferase family 4 protein [Syntrophobacterales bacterium]|jgi:glycosyltransferase involved in cell wall biosynthesis|nr:glycosyltransferase family 4 protein [Syntrophobacterales bacterium]